MSDVNVNGLTIHQPKQLEEKMYQQFNGVHSSNSSRSSSPMVKSNQIPPSQLPLNRLIPQSQLPPSRSSIMSSKQAALTLEQNVTTVPKLSIITSPVQNSSSFVSNAGLGFTTTGSKQLLSSGSPVGNNVPNTVPNLNQFAQQTHQTLTGNMKDLIKSSSYSAHERSNNNGPTSQKTQFQSKPPFSSGYFGEQKLDNQAQMQGSTPQTQIPAVKQSFLPQLTAQPQNLQSIPVQTSLLNQSSLNQQTTAFSQTGISPSMSNIPGKQNNPLAYNSHLLDVQNSLSNLNVGTLSPLYNSSFETKSVSNNSGMVRTLQPTNISPQQNLFRPQNQQTVLTQPPNFQQDIKSQANYNGSPTINSASSITSQKPNLSSRYPTLTNTNQQFANPQYANTFQQQQEVPLSHSQQLTKPQYPYQQSQYLGNNVIQGGFNKIWGTESIDLLQTPNILPPTKVEAMKIYLGNDVLDQANCSPDIFQCTMTKIPENNVLLQKSRLPLGVLIHPFRDLNHLPVIQCNVIVRCRACRTYINPFVLFIDNKRWKCNLCYRVNELPEEFQFDPVTKTYGDPSRRPEIKSSTLEYIAPAEYMLRPPQPAVYLFLLDVSRLAIESGYLEIVSKMLLEELKNLPGDARTQIGFIGYDSAIHFYSLPEGITQPHELTVLDVEDAFLPTPDNLLVNLKDRMDLVMDLLTQLPNRYANTYDTNSALGAALQVAYKMINGTGGRITVFQASLPNVGPGALTAREDPAQRASIEVAHLNPATDFYKRLALECSGQQIAVDLFLINSQYIDVATISGISKFSGGCIHHFPLLKRSKPILCQSFAKSFRRYLTRKIGFEAVMRIRCTRGLSIHTFHGNFFVRSTDLLSLPNINPDAGFGMQVAIEESLADVQTVCFQAALLYTSSKGERRIRVHTMCLPVASTLHDIINSADQQCIIGLLAKMAVDRSMQSSLSDAREAFINVAIDILSSFKMSLNLASPVSGLLVPRNLSLLPLYISALLKHDAFKVGNSRLDDRVMAMNDMKTKPLYLLIQQIYPDLYPIHELENQQIILNSEEESISMPPRLQLSARCLENKGAFLMDLGAHMIILVCPNISLTFLNEVLDVPHYNAMPEEMLEIPILDNLRNQRLHQFIDYLNEDKPCSSTIQVIRDNSTNRGVFFEKLIEDRVENALSYHEFLQHLKTQVK